MNYEQVNFNGIDEAEGLNANESIMLRQLVAVFNDRLANNRRRYDFYCDRDPLQSIGLTIPKDIARKVNTDVGWVAKAVDFLAMRSILDNFTTPNGESDTLSEILDENDFKIEYQKSVPSQLVHGVGFWTVSKGGQGEPRAVINYHNATSAAALWDFRKKRVKCGFVVEDYELVQYNGQEVYRPSYVVLHTDYAVIEIERTANGWVAIRKPHLLGVPLMVAMAFKPQDVAPFGKSRVSKSCMAIQSQMRVLIMQCAIHQEVFSSGQKAILGVSDEQFDSLQGQKFRAALSEMLVITRDENGQVPEIANFQQQSFEPFVSSMECLMRRMAAETSLPVAEFGLGFSGGYTSSDALRASSDSIIMEAESLNRNNGKALIEVAKLAVAIATNKTLAELDDDYKKLEVHWIDPSMPSAAAVADATVKLAGAVPEFGGTDIFWEMNGFNEEQRRRVKADMRSNATRAALNEIFKGAQAVSRAE